jgi:hypothetical protein
MSTSEIHAEITTAPRTALGRFCRSVGANSSSKAMQTAPTTPVNCDLEPACSATGVRDELLEIEKPWKRPEATFARPSPMISWFPSTL